MIHYIKLINIVLLVNTVTSVDFFSDQCPWVRGCKCLHSSNPKGGRRKIVSCDSTDDPALDLLPKIDPWSIRISKCRFYNVSLLTHLRKTKALRLFLLSNEFPSDEELYFDWQWIPDTMTNLSLVNNGFHGLRDDNKTDKYCNITRFNEPLYFSADDEKFTGIPSCLPHATNWLTLKRLPKSSQHKKIKWPPSLSILKLLQSGFGNYSINLFTNAPPTLRVIWIVNANLSHGTWPNGIPDTLHHLIIMRSQLVTLPPEETVKLGKANRLRALNLAFNKLTDIPSNMPPSLEILRMNHNNIKFITMSHWSTMTNLRMLDLSYNQLRSVPLQLPSSIKVLELQSNSIGYGDPEAFAHLKNLTFLNLESNRLTTLLRGLHPGIKSYIVGKNQISQVRDRSEYEFCINCTHMTLNGNPWRCDLKMLTMLRWLMNNGVGLYGFDVLTNDNSLKTRCRPDDLSGITSENGRSGIELVIEYMTYFEQPPNEKCVYELKSLRCQNAGLETLPDRLPPGLARILITDNSALDDVPDYAFADQQLLYSLNLNNNNLKHIPYGLPKTIKFLSMTYNRIGELNDRDTETLLNLTNLKAIYLDSNNIKMLYDWHFEGLKNLEWIGLSNNPLDCICSLESLVSYFTKLAPVTKHTPGRPYPTCGTPLDRKSRDIRTLQGFYRYSDCVPRSCSWEGNVINCSRAVQTNTKHAFYTEVSFQPGISVILQANSYWRTLDLTGLGLQTEQINYQNLTQLRNIILTDNSLTQVPVHGLPSSIRVVNLTRNVITSLPTHKDISTRLPNIQILDLRHNQIKIIGAEVSNLEVIPTVVLEGNPLRCECEARPFIHWMHANRENHDLIKRHGLQALSCTTQDDKKSFSIMEIQEGQYCQEFPVAGVVCGVVFGVFLLLLVIFLWTYYAQKKRESKIEEQILLGFQGLLEKERQEESDPETGIGMDKDYKFDAFVSYDPNSRTDVELVLALLEELEDKRGYTLCLNERDFIPGVGITDNIVECIGESKHIILILSNSFASSPWCQYEVQMSLAELHRRRKSQFIISLLFEDTSFEKDTASNMKTLLSLVSAIKVPKHASYEEDEEFWEKLEKLMPRTSTMYHD